MKRFTFRLERILGFRRSMTEGEKAHFAARVKELVGAEENASALRGVRNETLVARLKAFEDGLTAREAGNLHEHIVRINEAIGQADQEIDLARDKVDKARVKLVERRRDERAVELLRERRFSAWEKDYYRDEGKTLDDIGNLRHVRLSESDE
jgi:flagellar protein FliJ